MKTKALITVKNKTYPYSLERKKDGTVHIVCKDARIEQEFLTEDVADLLLDLPNLIMAEQNYRKEDKEVIRFRVSGEEKAQIEERAVHQGYTSVSQFLRDIALK